MNKKKTVTLKEVSQDSEVREYITQADFFLEKIGYTEHGFRHANLVAKRAKETLLKLAYSKRQAELAAMAGFLHDIGNAISRVEHWVSAALLAHSVLLRLGMDISEVVIVMNAIANHEEEIGLSTHPVGAALVIADKSDVHRGRVRNPDNLAFDIHDRVNFAAEKSRLEVNEARRAIELSITIDTDISRVMEYFEIFTSRMVMCRKAAEILEAKFSLVINDVELL